MANRKRKIKKVKVGQRRQTVLRVIAILLVVIVLLLIALNSFQVTTVSGMKDSVKSFFKGIGPGPGYPYSVNSSNVENIGVLNGDILIIRNDATVTLDTTAKQVKSVKHTYARPAVSISADRALVYDRAGIRYRVENRTDVIKSGRLNSEEKIITASVGKKGNLAFGTLCNTATSRVIVYDSTYKTRIFQWDCANYTVSSVALSDNGKYVGISVIGSENAEEYSKLFVFDVNGVNPIAEKEYLGTTVYKVNFSDNNDLVAVGDNATIFLKNFDKSTVIKYGDDTLTGYAFADNGTTVLCLAQYRSMNDQQLIGYRPSGKEDFRKEYTKPVKGIWTSDSRIAVLTQDTVDLYGLGGHLHRKVEAPSTSLKVLQVGNTSYVYSMGRIEKANHTAHDD